MITVVLFIIKKTYRNGKNSLAHNNVLALAEDKQGIIWIGTLGGGVQSLNPKTGLFTTYNTTFGRLDIRLCFLFVYGKRGLFVDWHRSGTFGIGY